MNDGWQVMIGAGESMAPLFGSHSVLVVDSAPFETLRTGMIAIYRDRSGDLVGHSLKHKDGPGWVAQGFNNWKSDSERVNDSNYVRIVFGVFSATATPSEFIANGYDIVYGKKN